MLLADPPPWLLSGLLGSCSLANGNAAPGCCDAVAGCTAGRGADQAPARRNTNRSAVAVVWPLWEHVWSADSRRCERAR